MIRLPDVALEPSAAAVLLSWQAGIDCLGSYADKVKAAARQFRSRNVSSNGTFSKVKKALSLQCSGARRCAYCEDSVADEIEHVRPKALYPEAVFAWPNYVYACGPCNGAKRSRFEVLNDSTGASVVITRSSKDPITPPGAGAPVLIDPRAENGLDFLELDLSGTFRFNPRMGLSVRDQTRAARTVALLGLNAREYLCLARSEAYWDYLRHLEAYVAAKASLANDLAVRAERFSKRQHPTVWYEMKRQRKSYEVLRQLFSASPELL